ncbi:MAG: hypothetical protein KGM91_12470, partial [Burkholderiales bacterium]|nr:hypothetical protein [Burkholderiales bacterium]
MIGFVGSLNMDLVARVPHIPAPGETVLGCAALARHAVNEGELQTLAGGDLALAAARGPRRVVVTLGARGAAAIDGARRIEQVAPTLEVVDSTGAGACRAPVIRLCAGPGAGAEARHHNAAACRHRARLR